MAYNGPEIGELAIVCDSSAWRPLLNKDIKLMLYSQVDL